MINDTIIVISSSNRAGMVKTHESFPQGVISWVIAVPADQLEEYKKYYPEKWLMGIPKSVPQFLPSQRQWIMENCAKNLWDYVWLMDDDLFFLQRGADLKLKKTDKEGTADMIHAVRDALDVVPMVGVSTRLGNNRVTDDYDEINRVTRCYAMSVEVFKKVGATFAPFEPFVAEDFHMALCWLNAGHKNRILHTFAQEDVGSNAPGGCSAYRTPAVQKKTSEWMTEHHPEVKIKAKKSTNWKGFGKHRVDMIIQWQQAFKPKRKRTGKWKL